MEGELIKPKCPPLESPSDFEKVRWSKEDYNREPVYYCKKCLSLVIMAYNESGISEYCNDCGSTDIATTSINEWQALYRAKYGKEF
jgi:hypothetical protein